MTNTNPRDLIQRLADELDRYKQLLMDDRREVHALAVEARAYIAHPEPEGPTPIPLADRQPTEADCDALGMCWVYTPHGDQWNFRGCADFRAYTHWLPHWALPVPQQQASQ